MANTKKKLLIQPKKSERQNSYSRRAKPAFKTALQLV